MILWNKSCDRLEAELKTATGKKREKILCELQRRWDEVTPRPKMTINFRGERRVLIIPRFDFLLWHP